MEDAAAGVAHEQVAAHLAHMADVVVDLGRGGKRERGTTLELKTNQSFFEIFFEKLGKSS